VYAFGVDPAWHMASNDLLFFNSMKMKMSVILGIIHMTWGICLRGVNCFYQDSGFGLDFFAEFLPMLIFDLAFFGYVLGCTVYEKLNILSQKRMGYVAIVYYSVSHHE